MKPQLSIIAGFCPPGQRSCSLNSNPSWNGNGAGSKMIKVTDTRKLHNQESQTIMSSSNTFSLASFPQITPVNAQEESFRPAEGGIKRLRFVTDESVQMWVQAEKGLLLYYSLTLGRFRKRALRRNPANGQSWRECIRTSTLLRERNSWGRNRRGFLESSEWLNCLFGSLEGILLKDKEKGLTAWGWTQEQVQKVKVIIFLLTLPREGPAEECLPQNKGPTEMNHLKKTSNGGCPWSAAERFDTYRGATPQIFSFEIVLKIAQLEAKMR